MDTYSIYGLDFDSVVGGDVVYINELSRKEKSDWEDKLIICEPNLFFCTFWCVLSQSVYLKGIRAFHNQNHIYSRRPEGIRIWQRQPALLFRGLRNRKEKL